MKIEHVALYVKDLESAKDFFVRFLDGKPNDGYLNESTGFKSYFISFENGSRLEIMNKPGIADNKKIHDSTGYSHIAFEVGSRQDVDELTERIKQAGYKIESGPRTTGDGYYESCIVAIEDNLIELTASETVTPREKEEEESEVDLDKFQRRRFITYAIFGVSIMLMLIGAPVVMKYPIIIGIALMGFLISVIYGFISGAMCCPYCGEPLGRTGFGEYCKHCGKKIFK